MKALPLLLACCLLIGCADNEKGASADLCYSAFYNYRYAQSLDAHLRVRGEEPTAVKKVLEDFESEGITEGTLRSCRLNYLRQSQEGAEKGFWDFQDSR